MESELVAVGEEEKLEPGLEGQKSNWGTAGRTVVQRIPHPDVDKEPHTFGLDLKPRLPPVDLRPHPREAVSFLGV
jgi:hypothetical protein